ncbi:hypothetical protein HZS55_12915 [Halosimplex rubrum]|uniref:Uncharacterized protein n=1 Tax=Halosimplex rubrum TaxID=869889 RepID=A0A7D5T623_9EURY|nr:hypothetical protein [Halosimplex rubrum]QLH78149.1 hypothetical protein HZS55_12915 [Halosimplex rubrum]
MTTQNLFSILAILLVLTSSVGAIGTAAASSPQPADIQFQQETPTPENETQANNSTNNTTSTPTATPTSTPSDDFASSNSSDDSGDTVVVVNGNSNNQSNESNASTTQSSEPPFDPADAEHEFNNGILLNERSHNQTHASFTIYNPTNETQWVVTNNNAGQEPRIKSYELKPNESKNLTTPTTGGLLGWAVSVTSTESIQSIETGAQYNIQYSALVINWNPAGDLGPAIGFVGGLVIIIMFVAVMKFNLRVGKIAIPLTGQPVQGVYQDEDLPSRDDPYSKQAKDMIHGFGLLGVVIFNWAIGVFAFWDIYPPAWFAKLLSGFGRLYDPSSLVTVTEVYSNLMVYWAYDVVVFAPVVYIIGKWYLRRNGIYLHDIDPRTGDNHTYLLSPTRFADLQVFKKGRDPNSGRKLKPKPVDKKRLAENNKDTDRRSYEAQKYNPRDNAAYLSWEGEKKQVKPSQLRRHERLVDYLLETSSTLWDRYGNLRDKFTILAQQESRRLNAKQTAQIEGGILEDGENTRDRLDAELQDAGFDDVVEGEERTIEDVVESATDESAPHLDSDESSDGNR